MTIDNGYFGACSFQDPPLHSLKVWERDSRERACEVILIWHFAGARSSNMDKYHLDVYNSEHTERIKYFENLLTVSHSTLVFSGIPVAKHQCISVAQSSLYTAREDEKVSRKRERNFQFDFQKLEDVRGRGVENTFQTKCRHI